MQAFHEDGPLLGRGRWSLNQPCTLFEASSRSTKIKDIMECHLYERRRAAWIAFRIPLKRLLTI